VVIVTLPRAARPRCRRAMPWLNWVVTTPDSRPAREASQRTPWAVIRQNPNRQRLIDSRVDCGARSLMPAALLVVLRSLALICGGHRAVALENLALRQQLAVFKRTVQRPPLRPRDRLFWVLLAHAWRNWRSALIVVQPETVVGWHRQWLRLQWTHRSTYGPQRRPFGRASTRWARRTRCGARLGSMGN